jgi:hypothetical protein
MEIWQRIPNGYQSETDGTVITDVAVRFFFGDSFAKARIEEFLSDPPPRTGMLLFPVMRILGFADMENDAR